MVNYFESLDGGYYYHPEIRFVYSGDRVITEDEDVEFTSNPVGFTAQFKEDDMAEATKNEPTGYTITLTMTKDEAEWVASVLSYAHNPEDVDPVYNVLTEADVDTNVWELDPYSEPSFIFRKVK